MSIDNTNIKKIQVADNSNLESGSIGHYAKRTKINFLNIQKYKRGKAFR